MHFLVFGETRRKTKSFSQKIGNFRLGPKKSKSASLPSEFNRENQAYIFWFLEKKKENEALLTKNRKLSLGHQQIKNAFLQLEFNRENLAYIFLLLKKKKRNEAILNTNRKCLLGPPKNETNIFCNGNSTWKI